MESENKEEPRQTNYSQTIVIQHMQPYLFEWCLAEYKQMQLYLQKYPVRLIIANSKTFLHFSSQNKKQLDQNQNYVMELKESFAKAPKGKCILVEQSVIQLTQAAVQSQHLKGPVCMLDMRAQKELAPKEQWSTLIFGGILGDHPPRDRPEPVRKHFSQIRHLGDLQLATDTAVLVTRLILNNQIPLKDIPMIKEPTIKGLNINGEKTSVQMEGFSYVSKELDIDSGKLHQNADKKLKKDIYMSQKVKQLLLRDDLDQNMIM